MKCNVFVRFVLGAILLFQAGVGAEEGGGPAQQRLDPPPGPAADPTGIDKCRFISFVPPGGGTFALRVHLTSLHHVNPPYTLGPTIAFSTFEGQSVWVGMPATYLESNATQVPFQASFTRCEPHYQDWGTISLLHVTGAHIAPSSIYHVEAVSDLCVGVEDSPDCQPGGINVSSQLEIRTTRFGDLEFPYNPPAPSRQPDGGDISSVAKKFRGVPGALIKARVYSGGNNVYGEITSSTLSVDVGLTPIANAVDAFRGVPYQFKMGKCGGNPSPPNVGACNTDSDCTGSNGSPPCSLFCPE